MIRELIEAYRIVKDARRSGYRGGFIILTDEAIQGIQIVYGRAIAENVQYQKVIADAIQGHSVCKYCQDYEECHTEEVPDESCDFFMLRFPDNDEAKKAFYRKAFKKEVKQDG